MQVTVVVLDRPQQDQGNNQRGPEEGATGYYQRLSFQRNSYSMTVPRNSYCENEESSLNLSDQMLYSLDSDQLRKRLVLRYPDGTYLHGIIANSFDSFSFERR